MIVSYVHTLPTGELAQELMEFEILDDALDTDK